MKKIVYISDFFVEEISGGAEIYDHILINLLRDDGFDVVRFKNADLSEKHIALYRNTGHHFVVSNFTVMSDEVSAALISSPGSYSIMEHDHKYVKTRNPSVYKDFLAPPQDIVNRSMYVNAKNIFAQSKIQAECIRKNLKIDHVVNLGMSLWTDKQLGIISDYLDTPKTPDSSVLESSNPTKNMHANIAYCKEKGIDYTLIGSPDYATFIHQLASHESHVFMPRVLESFNRVLIEARMLNCKVITTNLNGCISEDWFPKYKGKDLIEFVRKERSRVYNDFKKAIQRQVESTETESTKVEDVTVILNAYRRPYNLKMQIEAIRKQTVSTETNMVVD